MRNPLIVAMVLLLLSSGITTANPGGEGDALRSMECGGSCHGDPGSSEVSPSTVSVIVEDQVWAGLFTTVSVVVEGVEPSSKRLVGVFLLTNENGAKDTPAHEGWTIVSDANGGTNNYVELEYPREAESLTFTWTLRAPSGPVSYNLLATAHHGSEDGGTAFQGQSETITIDVWTPPEDLARLAADWKPPLTREIGEETTISLETEDVTSFTAEYRIDGGEPVSLLVSDGSFTLPAAVNPGVVEWRAHLEGDGPDQTTVWFRLVAAEPAWEVDETALFLQAFALLFLFAGLVVMQRPSDEIDVKSYDQTDQVPAMDTVANSMYGGAAEIFTQPLQTHSGPPLPPSGLPVGWTMEQWQHYGQEHLDSIQGGGLQ